MRVTRPGTGAKSGVEVIGEAGRSGRIAACTLRHCGCRRGIGGPVVSGDGAARVRVAVVDDHSVIHDGIAVWCATEEPQMDMIGGYHSIGEFETASPDPDVVVFELQSGCTDPNFDGIGRLSDKGFRVVVFSQHTDSSIVLRSLDRGAVIYLSKSEGREHLTAAIQAAATDQPYLSPTMAKAMSNDESAGRPTLSARERQVLISWFQTESKELVASNLFITVATVNTHLKRIRAKYAAAGRPASTKASLVARAIQDGLISPSEL